MISFTSFLCFPFTDDCHSYLEKWTRQFDHLDAFQWVFLTEQPKWPDIEKTMNALSENNHLDLSEGASQKIFEQFNYVNEYITEARIDKWSHDKKSADERWVECFKFLFQNGVRIEEFSAMVEYGFSLPGTSAPVERIFAYIKKIWKPESTQLQIQTLKSILYMKHNLKYTCTEFYEYLKSQPALLKQIGNSKKYERDENTSDGASTSAT